MWNLCIQNMSSLHSWMLRKILWANECCPQRLLERTGGWGGARFLFLLCISIHSSDILPTSTPFHEAPQSHPRIRNLGRKTMQDSSNTEWKNCGSGKEIGQQPLGKLGQHSCGGLVRDACPGAGYPPLWGARASLRSTWTQGLLMQVILWIKSGVSVFLALKLTQ